MSPIVNSRVSNLLCGVCLLLAGIFTLPQASHAQVRISPAAVEHSASASKAHADDQTATTLALNLCVDGSATYPCPTPVTLDDTYIPALSLIYGETLDGVAVYGPPTLDTGTITLYKDTAAVCTLVLGVNRSCPPTSTIFDVGNYTLTATLTFPPGSIYAESSAAPVVVSVAKDPTTIGVAGSPNPAALGSPVTFTATVSGEYPATPTGQVVFTLDGSQLPPVPLGGTGTATVTTSTLALGTHTMTASYAGALDFLAAADAQTTETIVPPATVTTIASSLNPSTVGESVTFSSTVSAAASSVTPTGSITFKDGTASLATVPLMSKGNQNAAHTTTSALTLGTHSITAIYSGDASASPSVSKVLIQQVNSPPNVPSPGYTITVSPASVALVAGARADLTVTVTEVGGFSEAIALSCSNLPNESACTFAQPTIPAGGGTTTLVLTTMSPHDCNSDVPYGGFGSLQPPASSLGGISYGLPALAGALFLFLPRRYRRLKALFSIVAVCALASLTGCGGHCTDFGTNPGQYTFKVTGTAQTVGAPSGATVSNATTSVALSVGI